jgi:aldose 1-epimerase
MSPSPHTIAVVPAGLPDAGKAIEAWTLGYPNGVSLEVWTLGATLAELNIPDRAGRLANVCFRFDSVNEHVGIYRKHLVGTVLGRFARCIKAGRFELDGVAIQLERNIDGHHFHGGHHGLHSRLWHARTLLEEDKQSLYLTIESDDGDEGYPGKIWVETRYILHRDGLLSIEFHAHSDRTTIIGLSPHIFWNLAGHGSIDSHFLRLDADHLIATDEMFIPLAIAPRAVDGGEFDFRHTRAIGRQPIDNCWINALRPGALLELIYPDSGRRLSVTTDQPALAIYSADHLPIPRVGLCIQPSAYPDAPNRPDFPSCRLAAGQTHQTRIDFRFDSI